MNQEPTLNSHCSYCGTRFTEQKLWPRKCFRCYNDSFNNPIPVVVVLIRVKYTSSTQTKFGLLIQQRNIEPKKGFWALTGGYINSGETWEEAAAREVHEELGLSPDAKDFTLMGVESSTNKKNMLIICFSNKIYYSDEIIDWIKNSNYVPNDEVQDLAVIWEPMELAFPAHTQYIKKFFDGLTSSQSVENKTQ